VREHENKNPDLAATVATISRLLRRTANYGAAETRKEVIRRLTQERDKYIHLTEVWVVLNEEVKWVRGMATRAGKRKGGLGRR